MRFPSHEGLSRTFNKNQDLVNTFVYSPANVFTRKDTHQDHLRIFVREQDLRKLLFSEANCWTFLYCIELDSFFKDGLTYT